MLNRFSTLLAAVLTDAIDLEIVTRCIKVVFAADLFFQFAYLRGEKLNRSATLSADHVMVAAAIKLVLVAGHSIREWDGAGQPAFGQKLKRTVYRGKSDLGVFFPYQTEKLVGRKMIAGFQERTQDRVALIGMLQTYTFQVLIKNILGLPHGLARWRSMIVDTSLEHGL